MTTDRPPGSRRSFRELTEEMVARTFPDADPAWKAQQVSAILADVEHAVRGTTTRADPPPTEAVAETVEADADADAEKIARILPEESLAPSTESRSRLFAFAAELLSEAEHRFEQQGRLDVPQQGLLSGGSLQSLGELLTRARTVIGDRPGTAVALTQEVLRELDALHSARATEIQTDERR